MGLDGGTVITRSDVLRGQSWEVASADDNRSTRGGQVSTSYTHRRETADAYCAADSAWTTCSLSGEALREGEVVACALGRLYNRQAVVEHLLAMRGTYAEERTAYQLANRLAAGGLESFTHLQSIRDVFAVQLTAASAAASVVEDADTSTYACPVSGARAGRAGVRFSALRPCGHVVATRVLANLHDEICAVCSVPIKRVVALNPPREEQEAIIGGAAAPRKRKRRAADNRRLTV